MFDVSKSSFTVRYCQICQSQTYVRYESEAEPPSGSDCRTFGESTNESGAGLSRIVVIRFQQRWIRVQRKHLAFIVEQLTGEEVMEYMEYY
jgi:hypothetical protein